MKFLRLDLLTLLISLFTLGSCKNQNDIGLPPDDQQINGTLIVDNNVVVNTVAEDPVISGGYNNNVSIPKTPLARFTDNQIGETISNIAASIDLPASAAYTLPAGVITTDSAVLELRYNDGFYGDSLTSKYKVKVYQLSGERPTNSQTYYSNKTWAHGDEVIGGNTQAFNARPKTPVKVMRDSYADTPHFASPHIRVPISTAFINKELFGAPASHLTSNAAFQNAVKGLYLTLEHNQPSEAGGSIMLNLDSCRINVYYRTNNAGTLDTAVVSLPFTRLAHAAEVIPNYNSTVKAALDKGKTNPTQSSDVFYLQGGLLRAKVSFPNLESLFGTTDISKVALNRAELVITPVAGTTVPYAPLPQLTMYGSDIALQRRLLPDANGSVTGGALDPYYFSTAVFGGQYDKTKQQYRFVVTGYIQNLLNKKTIDYGTYIAPIDSFLTTNAIPIAPTIQTAGRTVAIGSNASSANRIKLNIIYSK